MKLKYRTRSRGLRQKKKMRNILIISAVLLLLLIFTVIFGNFLGSKSRYTREHSAPMPEDAVKTGTGEIPASSAPEMLAYPLSLSELAGSEPSELAATAEKLSEAGYTGVSVRLTDGDGKPLYSSAAYQDPDGESGTTGCDLSAVISAMHACGLRVVGCLDVHAALSDGSGAGSEVMRSRETAIIREAAGMGIDEVLLSGLEFSQSSPFCALSLEYAEELKGLLPSLTVGICFDLDSADMGDTGFEMLLSRADYLAVKLPEMQIPPDAPDADEPDTDGTDADEPDEPDGQGSDLTLRLREIVNGNMALFTRYSPRVVIPLSQDENNGTDDLSLPEALRNALSENMISSCQIEK